MPGARPARVADWLALRAALVLLALDQPAIAGAASRWCFQGRSDPHDWPMRSIARNGRN
jgi:hypothetical protein